LAPVAAVERSLAVKTPTLEIGAEYSVYSIAGTVFECCIMVPIKDGRGIDSSKLIMCRYLLAVTDTQVIEMYPHASKSNTVITTEIHELKGLLKVKFKKAESHGLGFIVLEYRGGKLSKLLMKDPTVCVEFIKEKMSMIGMHSAVKSKHENELNNALAYFNLAVEFETSFSLNPTIESIKEMMELLKKAAEKFDAINDESYIAVLGYIKSFLQRADVIKILDDDVLKSKQKQESIITKRAASDKIIYLDDSDDAIGHNDDSDDAIGHNDDSRKIAITSISSPSPTNDVDNFSPERPTATEQHNDEIQSELGDEEVEDDDDFPTYIIEDNIDDDDFYKYYECSDKHLLEMFSSSSSTTAIQPTGGSDALVSTMSVMLNDMNDEFNSLLHSFSPCKDADKSVTYDDIYSLDDDVQFKESDLEVDPDSSCPPVE
jgi:hypothetical protein